MCDAVTAASLALSAGGSYLQSREAAKNQDRITDARNNAYEAGMIKQRAFADESGAAFNDNISKQGREQFDQQKDQSAQEVKQAFNDIRVQPDYNDIGGAPASTPKNVVIARKAASDEATAKTNRDLEGMAGLSGYTGAGFSQDMSRNNFARLFGNIQDNASRQSALIPLEMSAAANNASKAPSLFPTLLKVGGSAMGMYGAANGITSFGDKVAFGPLNKGQTWADMTQPGLFTKIRQIPGNFY